LPTVVRYPVEGPAGPYPLIVFAHGFNTTPETYANLLHAWAGAGYVVAAPAFPRTAADRPLDEEDLINQPGDISFVITRLLEASRGPGPLTGRIDPARIGVAGHSDGGITTLGAGYNSCCRDARISADVVGAADLHDFPGGTYFSAAGPPLLVIQGDQDTLNPPEFSQQVFDDAHSPKYLLWLINAQHLEPYTSDQPHLQVVEQATTAFFDTYLKARPDGPARLRAAASSSLASLRAG
jgi:predicted dienelactone hydrolase